MHEIAILQENIEELRKKLKRESVAYQHAIDNGLTDERKRMYGMMKISMIRIQIAMDNLKAAIDLSYFESEERENKHLLNFSSRT